MAPGARCLPSVGSHSETSLPVSDTTYGIPSNCLLGPRPCTGSSLVIPDSVCPGAAVETLGGPAFEPLDHNRLGAFYCVCRAPEREFGLLVFDLVAGRAPEPLLGARGRSGVSLSLLCGPRASFSFGRRGGVCQATLGGRAVTPLVSLLTGKSKWRPVPLSIGVS